jgi:ABC-type glycerol-3-phosphate transport system substrate-binding protein
MNDVVQLCTSEGSSKEEEMAGTVRKITRRNFLVYTSLATAGALAACVPAAPAAAPAEQAEAGGQAAAQTAATELEWWVTWGEGVWGDACDNIAKMYMEQAPDVKVNVLKGGADLEKLLTAVAGGTPPHTMTSIWTPDLALRGALLPIDDMIDSSGLDRANFFDAQWTRSSWAGQAYGLPAVESAFIVGLGWTRRRRPLPWKNCAPMPTPSPSEMTPAISP